MREDRVDVFIDLGATREDHGEVCIIGSLFESVLY